LRGQEVREEVFFRKYLREKDKEVAVGEKAVERETGEDG
jgi:hypothetical protein